MQVQNHEPVKAVINSTSRMRTYLASFIALAVSGVVYSLGHMQPAFQLCLLTATNACAQSVATAVVLLLIVLRFWFYSNSESHQHKSVEPVKNLEPQLRSSYEGEKAREFLREQHISGTPTITPVVAAVGGDTDEFFGCSGRETSTTATTAAVIEVAPEQHHGGVPDRYLRGCKGDAVEAERRWRLTQEWRAQERVDEVLQEPQPHFAMIKRHYPHGIHRRARNGCPIWIERRMDLPAVREGGVSLEALRRHYLFVTEYLWRVVEPDFDRGQVVTVLDVAGLGLRDLAGEAVGFVKQATNIIQEHYVERSNRMFIINAPSYFSMFWRIIQPMLNERMKAKIGIISGDQSKIAAALLEVISPENLPVRYGGTCPLDLGESEEEQALRAYVESITPSLLKTTTSTTTSGYSAWEDGEQTEGANLNNDLTVSTSRSSSTGAEVAAVEAEGVGALSQQGLEELKKTARQSTGAPHRRRRRRRLLSNSKHGDSGELVREQDGRSSSCRSRSRSIGGDSSRRSSSSRPSTQQRSAARRALGKIGGVLSCTGSGSTTLATASSVAHLGDENAMVYDPDLQRWTMRDKGENSGCRAGGRSRRWWSRNRERSQSRVESESSGARGSPLKSNVSEKTTVLVANTEVALLAEGANTPAPEYTGKVEFGR